MSSERLESSAAATEAALGGGQQATQSVFLDQLILPGQQFDCLSDSERRVGKVAANRLSPTSTVATSKSKSTTLDSGVQSWDLVSNSGLEDNNSSGKSRREQEQSRPSRQLVSASSRRRGFSLSRSFSTFRQREPTKEQAPSAEQRRQSELRPSCARMANLSSLFRSKSMRSISSGKKTDGRLQGGLVGRAGSASKDFDCDLRDVNEATSRWVEKSPSERQATIDYLATAQPHKRSFSVRAKNSLLAFNGCGGSKENYEEHSSGARIVLFLRRLFSVNRRSQSARFVAQDDERTIERLIGGAQSIRPLAARANLPRQRLAPAAARFPCSPSSSSSSGSNSLIEILDCSPAVSSSRRALREERALSSSSRRAATWKLVERPNSSLSQESQASQSTTKSTVSQQLRRHLDEAYKRHRNCTSQREKEFIDSINILRQASRHALQNERPSSKSRQLKSVSSRSDESGSSSSSSGREEPIGRQCHCHEQVQLEELHEDDMMVNESGKASTIKSNNQNCQMAQHFDLMSQPFKPLDGGSLSSRQSRLSLENCCLCSQYLNSARLCPLAAICCPASGAFSCCQPQTTAPTSGRHNHRHHQPQQLPAEQDFCCPIWRSMVSNYWQPLYAATNNQSLSATDTCEQLGRFENFSSLQQLQQQQQQHQHNTTIDLKIEIGADFGKAANGNARLMEEEEAEQDSLDNSDQTDESHFADKFAELEGSNDSCESDSKSDSLTRVAF